MFSIFIMYSTDRAKALEHTLSCLRDMPLYDRCQRTLVVDGKIDRIPHDWQAVQVPRLGGGFCWGRMWDAGVYSARHANIVYLDSDRLLPRNFLELAADRAADDVFVFTSKHFLMSAAHPVEECKRLLAAGDVEEMLLHPDFFGKYRFEARHGQPYHGPGKNVMSGSVAFTKKTYTRLGGVDQWYCGHGAFADSDFHMQASVGGCSFVDLEIPEFHYPHDKVDGSRAIDEKTLYRMGLDNFIYYCHKWGLSMALAEGLAVRCGVPRVSRYVDKKLKEITEGAKGS